MNIDRRCSFFFFLAAGAWLGMPQQSSGQDQEDDYAPGEHGMAPFARLDQDDQRYF